MSVTIFECLVNIYVNENYNEKLLEKNYITEAKPTRRMSVCSSGVQRRKKLENKQKFVFDVKDVVAPPPRAAVRSSVQVKPYFFFMLFALIPVPFLYLHLRIGWPGRGKGKMDALPALTRSWMKLLQSLRKRFQNALLSPVKFC